MHLLLNHIWNNTLYQILLHLLLHHLLHLLLSSSSSQFLHFCEQETCSMRKSRLFGYFRDPNIMRWYWMTSLSHYIHLNSVSMSRTLRHSRFQYLCFLQCDTDSNIRMHLNLNHIRRETISQILILHLLHLPHLLLLTILWARKM